MKIDFVNKKIVVTKKFLEMSSRYGTEEFQQMVALTKELPEFEIQQKISAPCRTPLKGLTYSKMEYIIRTEGEADDLEMFNHFRSMGFSYGSISRWFLTRYPAANEKPLMAA